MVSRQWDDWVDTETGHTWEVVESWREDGGLLRRSGIEIRCPHVPPHDLSSRALLRFARSSTDRMPVARVDVGDAIVAEDGTWTEAGPEPAQGRTGRPKVYGPDHYRQVANVYRLAAHEAGRRPLQAVMREFGFSRSTASRHIAEARRLGLLEGVD